MPTSNDILRGTSLHVRRQIGDLLDSLLPGGAAAPAVAEYILKSSNASLPNGRVLTDNTYITWDYSLVGAVRGIVLTAPSVPSSNSSTNSTLGNISMYPVVQTMDASNIIAGQVFGP